MADPKPNIPQYGKIEKTEKLPEERKTIPDKNAFESYMSEGTEKTENIEHKTPMDLARERASTLNPSISTLNEQVEQTSRQMNDIKDKLSTPNLKLKKSHEALLDSKFNDANKHLTKAIDYLGAPKGAMPEIPAGSEPVAKFLNFISSGQTKLFNAKSTLEEIQKKGGQLSPSEMMLVQVNLSQAQQEIEFSSVLLSKVVGALRQILSTQL